VDFVFLDIRKIYKIFKTQKNMAWKTFLVVYFKSGNRISEIIKKVEKIGFTCVVGPVDFIYHWKTKPTKEQIIELADKLSEILKGTDTIFNIDTHEG